MKHSLTPLSIAIVSITLLIPTTSFARYDSSLPWYQHVSSRAIEQSVSELSSQAVEFLPLPVLYGIGLEDFSPNFGVPRSGGRTHAGQDIVALTGTPIVSPTQAVVTHITNGPSAGHSVYTANPGGETFAYLHLDRIPTGLSEGDVLEVGDLLGYVGNTGNASAGAAHLHFEILQDKATNPYPRIAKEFTLKQKMQFTEKFLSDMPTSEATELANFLRINFADEFALAKRQNILLPTLIAKASTNPIPQTELKDLATSLTIGSRGTAVIALQKKLIAILIGPKAIDLQEVGATGYYGSLTQAALDEYEAYLAQPKTPLTPPPTVPENITTPEALPIILKPTQASATTLSGMPQVNLKKGETNNYVVWLQQYLITKQSGPQATKLKETGATGYFGPLTQAALAEYQAKVGISPAVGFYGPVTRKFIIENT